MSQLEKADDVGMKLERRSTTVHVIETTTGDSVFESQDFREAKRVYDTVVADLRRDLQAPPVALLFAAGTCSVCDSTAEVANTCIACITEIEKSAAARERDGIVRFLEGCGTTGPHFARLIAARSQKLQGA